MKKEELKNQIKDLKSQNEQLQEQYLSMLNDNHRLKKDVLNLQDRLEAEKKYKFGDTKFEKLLGDLLYEYNMINLAYDEINNELHEITTIESNVQEDNS